MQNWSKPIVGYGWYGRPVLTAQTIWSSPFIEFKLYGLVFKNYGECFYNLGISSYIHVSAARLIWPQFSF